MPKRCQQSSEHVQKSHIKVGTAEDLRRWKRNTENLSHRGSGGSSPHGGSGGSPFFQPKFSLKPSTRQVQKYKNFAPSIACYTIFTCLCITYICEWKDVLQYLPYYRGKYKNGDENE